MADDKQEEIPPHNCEKHLDRRCKCKICGKYRHKVKNDSNGSGTGMVTAWCKRCGAYERFYDDTGTTIESTFPKMETPNYKGPLLGGQALEKTSGGFKLKSGMQVRIEEEAEQRVNSCESQEPEPESLKSPLTDVGELRRQDELNRK
ncbi:MAG TPA: hypothetical protein DEB24_02910 [Coriobacteriia bacterium]|nr:hypothetical protein [Coriobacteriia bacterium]